LLEQKVVLAMKEITKEDGFFMDYGLGAPMTKFM
jgi:hypothetical protein